ncbi:MAG: FAD-dependent oxidoreductase [Rhodobiaceae bacterium]|nr:FAD-dependent oxidoreductase [Rhodobiaceae bacterium]MCC0040760.1 FAD-dependent oxidoreductase [Rhodobiaceae bacterium]
MSADNTLPSHASVVVIGGGVMGCSTLYHLADAGLSDAVLLERNKLTSGTTWHSAAQVRALRSTRNLTELIRYSVSLYSKLEEETGQATGWINKGSLSIATSFDRLTHILRQEALARLFGVRATAISAGEAKERWPLMNADDVIGAVWSPDDGRVSPSDLCAALVKGARANGARIFENCGVTGILTKDGRIAGVETPLGTIRCDAVALCTGLWSRKAASMAGAAVPVWPCEHFYLLTKPVEGIAGNVPSLSDHDGHLYIRDDSGGLLVGCFEPMGKPIDPDRLGEDFAFQLLPEDWDHFEPMMVNALHRLPVLETAEVKVLLNGPESFTPDGSFLLGETAETRGLYLGCGMNSVGVATGGGAGMALAHAIMHGHMPADLGEADPKRFPDCFNSVAALTQRVPEVLGKHYEITYPNRQWSSARGLRKLPLHEAWTKVGASFGQVYGWERPLHFGGPGLDTPTFGKPGWFDAVRGEVMQAHEKAAVFDQSTFGKIEVEGPDACALLERVCANRMDRAPGRAIYTAMLNPRGGIESDLTAVRIAGDHYRLFVGTSAIRRDLAWLSGHADAFRVKLTDSTELYAVLGLMGPRAAQIASDVGADELNALRYFEAGPAHIAGKHVRATRLSYVGEAGWEITCKAENAGAVWQALHEVGARPAGLLAQTSMRIEKRFLAYGHDLDTDTSPLHAGLGFAVAWDTDFIGRDALLAQRDRGVTNRIATIILDDETAVPLGNEPVYWRNEIVGKTTSAAFGHRVGKPLALADFKSPDALVEGAQVTVDIAGTRWPGRVTLKPAFDPEGARMKS